MKTNEITRIAFLACIEFVVFTSFSDILYLECITMTIVLFALVFDRRECFWAAVVFGVINMIIRQGMTPWSLMYLIIYPSYTLLISWIKPGLLHHPIRVAVVTGVLSFLTGQFLQLPFILFSKKITVFYLIVGLKTSLFQGIFSGVASGFLYAPLYRSCLQIERRTKHGKKI